KPMITSDLSAASRFRDNVYVAWDAASGGSTGGGVRVGASSDHGATFNVTRADDPSGPGRSIGASPAVGPNGELYVAWNDYVQNVIAFNRSFDGGKTWETQRVVSTKTVPLEIAVPAESFRRALVYPSLGVDTSSRPHRCRPYCSWLDWTANGVPDILISYPDNQGQKRSSPQSAPAHTLPPHRGNQQGDYEGLVSYGGASYPVWTDSRRQLDSLPGCSRGLVMEEVFTAKVTP